MPCLRGDRELQRVDEVPREHDLPRHLVELRRLQRRQRVVLAVDGAGLQAEVDLGEGERRRVRAERLPQEEPLLGARHAQLHPGEIGRGPDRPRLGEAYLSRAEIDGLQQLDSHRLGDFSFHFIADRPAVDFREMIGIADQVAGGEDRVLGKLSCDVLHRQERHLEIAALHGDGLRALAKEGPRVMHLHVEAAGRRAVELVPENVEHLDVPVLRHRGRGDAQHRFRLPERGRGREQAGEEGRRPRALHCSVRHAGRNHFFLPPLKPPG